MKRVVPAFVLALLTLSINGVLIAPARADCPTEIKNAKDQLAALRDEHRRQELQKLIEKAEKDEKAGRGKLCHEDLERASALLK